MRRGTIYDGYFPPATHIQAMMTKISSSDDRQKEVQRGGGKRIRMDGNERSKERKTKTSSKRAATLPITKATAQWDISKIKRKEKHKGENNK